MTDRDALDPALIPYGATVYWFDAPGRYPATYVDSPTWPYSLTLLNGPYGFSGTTTVQWHNQPLAPASGKHKSRTRANALVISYPDAVYGLGHTDRIAEAALNSRYTQVSCGSRRSPPRSPTAGPSREGSDPVPAGPGAGRPPAGLRRARRRPAEPGR